MQKESQTEFVHRIGLGKRQTLSDEAPEPLPQSIVPPLDMRREAGLFARRGMLLGRDDQRVSFPKVAVAMSRSRPGRYPLPEFLTSRPAPVANDIGHDLSGSTTQRDPYPAFVGAL